ncbi:MAG: 2Fe-2S iron-sulfur cluster-binding protein [Bacteroidia bacterium]
MPLIELAGSRYESHTGETVLTTLLRHGIAVSNSCRAGACQACLLRAATGTPPAAAQEGLNPALVAQGYFLACQWSPTGDIAIANAAALDVPAILAAKEPLSPSVLRVTLHIQGEFDARPGQYVTLMRSDGLARPYSIAKIEANGIDLHIRRIPDGKLSGWLFDEAAVGEPLTVRGPAGHCFYVPGNREQPMLLAGTGTGLAPLYGIVHDALRHGHQGSIVLYHGAVDEEGLYLCDELHDLAARHDSFRYEPVVLAEGSPIRTGKIDQVISADHPKLTGWRAYLCGDAAIVNAMKKRVFLAGMASREILSDPFLPAACN